MATVTSFTSQKILELLSGWEGVGADQIETNVLVGALSDALQENMALIEELNSLTLPQIEESLAENGILVADLNDNILPTLQQVLEENAARINDIATVDIPNIALDLANNIENTQARPNVYVQDEAPTNPDEDDRYLIVGDSWFDSNDNNKQRIWNGVEWTTFEVDIPDLSLTVVKFKTSTHMIY